MVLAGANREGDTPVPIPNTEVKPLIADGTAEFALWESRTVPHSTHTAIKRPRFGGVFLCPDKAALTALERRMLSTSAQQVRKRDEIATNRIVKKIFLILVFFRQTD